MGTYWLMLGTILEGFSFGLVTQILSTPLDIQSLALDRSRTSGANKRDTETLLRHGALLK